MPSCPGVSIRRKRRAFTMIEMAAVVALIAIFVAIGIGSLRSSMPRFRMIQTAKQLKADLMALRMTAIQNQRETRLLLVDADASWNQSGQVSAGQWKIQVGNKGIRSTAWDTRRTVDISRGATNDKKSVSLTPWESLVGPGINNGDAIVFGPRGTVINPASDFGSDGTITLTLINKRALPQGREDTVSIKIAVSGMVRMITSMQENQSVEFGTDNASTMGGS